ncbi:MAG: SulP family inorganic anion transporter [Lewinellaceae bacterium]|nr:SulP family inorganic anion transporter [Lewinellaceae bacterium]
MRVGDRIKLWMHQIAEEVQSTLPDEIHFSFREHVLPLFFPFLGWKPKLKQPGVLRADFQAGLIGAVLVLPQAIAFAAIAGLPPIYGLYTAMVLPIVAALFGSSWHSVTGPAAPTSLVIFAAVSKFAMEGSPEFINKVLLITFMAGAIQLLMALGRLGRYISFVSQTVVVGFTAGAAVLIISNQMKNVLGLRIVSGASFIEIWQAIFQHVENIHLPIVLVALYTLIVAIVSRKLFPGVPHFLVGLAAGTAFAWFLGGPYLGIPFTADVPRRLPAFSVPGFSAYNFYHLMNDAFAIALFGVIQTVAIGRAIGMKSGQQVNSNQELFGQGLANLCGSFFSCYFGAASFTRSGLNYQAGAKTPMAAIFSALLLGVLVLAFAPYARFLPVPVISVLIILIGWALIDVPTIRGIHRASKQENFILGVTFFATLFTELAFAVFLGVLLSLFFYLRRSSAPNIAVMTPDSTDPKHSIVNTARKDVPQCPQVKIIRIDGPIFFGAIDHIVSEMRSIRQGSEKT